MADRLEITVRSEDTFCVKPEDIWEFEDERPSDDPTLDDLRAEIERGECGDARCLCAEWGLSAGSGDRRKVRVFVGDVEVLPATEWVTRP